MHIAFTLTIKYRNLPIPYLSFSKDKRYVQTKTKKQQGPRFEPLGHKTNITPIVLTPQKIKVKREDEDQFRHYAEQKRYKVSEVALALITWLERRNNKPITTVQIISRDDSPVRGLPRGTAQKALHLGPFSRNRIIDSSGIERDQINRAKWSISKDHWDEEYSAYICETKDCEACSTKEN